MSSLKWIVAIFFFTASDVFLSSTAAQGYFTGNHLNCETVKSKYRPFKAQNAVWKSIFGKQFTEQEIETAKCAAEGAECFVDVFTVGADVKGICKTQTLNMAVDMYQTDKKIIVPHNVNNIHFGCYCQLQDELFNTYGSW